MSICSICVYILTHKCTQREEETGAGGGGIEREKGERLLCLAVNLRHGSVCPLLDVLHSVIWQCYFEHEAYGRGQTTGLWLSLPC